MKLFLFYFIGYRRLLFKLMCLVTKNKLQFLFSGLTPCYDTLQWTSTVDAEAKSQIIFKLVMWDKLIATNMDVFVDTSKCQTDRGWSVTYV